MVSPSFPYSNPPPPYTTHHAPAASAPPASLAGLISPPESRRTSGDEKEQKHPATRQSLPSIHEALASEQPMSYPHSTPSAPPPASQFFQPPPLPATSHPDPSRRHYSQDFSNKEPPASYSQQTERSPFMKPPPHVPPYSQAQQDPPRPTLPVHNNPKLPTLHPLRTEQLPVTSSRPSFAGGYPSYSQQNSPAYEQNSQQQAGPVQQQQQQPFGYNNPYPPGPYPYSAPPPPPPPSQANPPYPPSAPAYSAPAGYPPAWRSDGAEVRRAEENKRAGRHAGPTLYGESVKRHLDNFDFEASLNEVSQIKGAIPVHKANVRQIAEGSGRLNDFLRVYGQRAHQAQRSGPVPGSTPAVSEVDDLIKQGQRIVESLARIREVVLTTQQAHLAEQAQDPRYKATTNGYEPDESHHSYGEDPKGAGGFAGSDPKKRRG
ncbi:hypothetical protein SLS56_007025, partial [Neofusicoccum ribis]